MQYRRIATEEAWAIPEQFDAWRDLLKKSTDYDPDLFLARAQTDGGLLSRRLLDVDEERLRIMDEARRRCAPAGAHFDGCAGPRDGTRCFHRSARQRSPCCSDRATPDPLRGPRHDCAAGPEARGERDGAGDQYAETQRRHDQLAHQRRISRRAEVLADPRGRGRARRADLYPSALAFAGDGAALSQVPPRARDLGLCRRNGAARGAPHHEWRIRQVPDAQDRHRAHGRKHPVCALSDGLDACARPSGHGPAETRAHARASTSGAIS